jgi:hypothetical protein
MRVARKSHPDPSVEELRKVGAAFEDDLIDDQVVHVNPLPCELLY